eukprot:TRINITY_DN5554_c0_g1_i1.p1 TRINITY_DN5554_c0_g1~~TRINITY_DN5554_c0_g1_i1.p1  ORF type:complete len:136 (+),score=1.19 TRINITY_DN5554_c0_g1_i1:38-445(+)
MEGLEVCVNSRGRPGSANRNIAYCGPYPARFSNLDSDPSNLVTPGFNTSFVPLPLPQCVMPSPLPTQKTIIYTGVQSTPKATAPTSANSAGSAGVCFSCVFSFGGLLDVLTFVFFVFFALSENSMFHFHMYFSEI